MTDQGGLPVITARDELVAAACAFAATRFHLDVHPDYAHADAEVDLTEEMLVTAAYRFVDRLHAPVEGAASPTIDPESMSLAAYEVMARRTAGDALSTGNARMILAALGLAGESGEFADTVKKYLYHDHPMDREHMIEEVGDILWYVVAAARALDCTMDEIAAANLAKLSRRYPDGFSAEASRDRAAIPK